MAYVFQGLPGNDGVPGHNGLPGPPGSVFVISVCGLDRLRSYSSHIKEPI